MKEGLRNIGQYIIDNFKYDAIGMSGDSNIITIGFQNNPQSSCMVWINEDTNTFSLAFHEKCSKSEVFDLCFRVFSRIGVDFVINPDYS